MILHYLTQKVCEHISRYNPLYICGGGLKTHLLNAIGQNFKTKTMLCLFQQKDYVPFY